MQMAKDFQGDGPQGVLADLGEYRIAQFAKGRGQNSRPAIGQNEAQRQHQQGAAGDVQGIHRFLIKKRHGHHRYLRRGQQQKRPDDAKTQIKAPPRP